MTVYEAITNRILELLDKGIVPWKQPWDTQMPINLVSKKEYRGINILLLSFTGYHSPYWLTYIQAKALGGYVKAGSKGIHVVYWNFREVKVDGKDEEPEKMIPFLKYHTVFNAEQCENIPIPQDNHNEFPPIENCERVIREMPNKPDIFHDGSKACYIPSKDMVVMPRNDTFHNNEEYYSTLYHELIHSTGHVSRLNRKNINDVSAFGSDAYSKEELIAEIGASFLCGITGIANKTISNATNYIGNWLNRLRNDKKLIIAAASQAQRAADYILNKNPLQVEREG